jgi:excisionase family DNA binding protein
MKTNLVDLNAVAAGRANLERIAREHPALVDNSIPKNVLAREWENILEGILMGAEKSVFSVEEVAELFQCHKDTIRRAIHAGKLKAAKLGKDYRISRADLESFYRTQGGGELFAEKGEPQ